MNKLQTVILWLGGLIICALFIDLAAKQHISPNLFLKTMTMAIPVLIISGLLIITVNKKNAVANDFKNLKSISSFIFYSFLFIFTLLSYAASDNTEYSCEVTENLCEESKASCEQSESSCDDADSSCNACNE